MKLRKRLDDLESVAGSRVRYMFRWRSQDHDEAMERWKAALAARGYPLKASDTVCCIVWNDTNRHVDWSLLDAPSFVGEVRDVA